MNKREDFIGSWQMVSWRSLKDGEPDGYPMGEDAKGQIVYAAEGRMAAFLMRADFEENSQTTLPTAQTMISYGGTWRVEGEEIVHDVIFATLPHWIGRPLVRRVERQGERILLRTAPEYSKSGKRYEHELLWERVA
ncbi:lipocalin-like domain-containing protein [Rhodovibrionaceae bacterium A322]